MNETTAAARGDGSSAISLLHRKPEGICEETSRPRVTKAYKLSETWLGLYEEKSLAHTPVS
jgi:hypothetical protein